MVKKMYFINKPSKDGKIIDIIPPLELHLLLGVIKHTYKRMLTDFEEDQSNVSREVYNKGPSFIENTSKILLEKIDILKSNHNLGCLKCLQCFFCKCVNSCSANTLNPKFAIKFKRFIRIYLELYKQLLYLLCLFSSTSIIYCNSYII